MEKSFELTAETKYGGTVTNVKRKRVPGGGRGYSKTTRAKECVRTRGTTNKLQSDERSLRDGAYCQMSTRKLCYHKMTARCALYMSVSHVSSQSQTRVKLNRVFYPF